MTALSIVSAPATRRRQAHISCCGHTTIWTLLGVSIALLGVGIGLSVGFGEDVRKDRVAAYNVYVDKWRAYIAEQKYSEPEFRVTSQLYCANDTGGYQKRGDERVMLLGLDTRTTDKLEDGRKDGAKPLEPQHKWTDYQIWKDVKQNFEGTGCYLRDEYEYRVPGTGTGFAKLDEISTSFSETRVDGQDQDPHKCEKKSGVFFSGMCYYPMAIRETCVKVKMTSNAANGQPEFEIDYEVPEVEAPGTSNGCYYSRNTKSFRPHHFVNEPVWGLMRDYKIEYYVRYSEDAWLGYMRATENTGYFGMDSEPLLILGIVLALVGAAGLGVFTLLFVRTMRKLSAYRRLSVEETNALRSSCFITVW